MTDKEEIIIDGVDVSECLFYQINFEEDHEVKIKHFCSIWHNSCESINNSNCYFKQLQKEKFENLNNRQMVESAENLIYENSELYKNLKEKEQECEKYKKLAADFKDVNKQLGYKYLTIKQECEELKKLLETSEEWRIKAESLNEKLELRNTCYRKALDEIEEYCNSVSVEENLYNSRHFYNGGVAVEVVNEILNIINKAKG